MGRSCAFTGGCPSDYIAIAISVLSILLLLGRAILPFLLQKVAHSKASGFWLIVVQIIGSINLIFSLVMSINLIKMSRRQPWQSCYLWAVWIEGPLGFGLLMSCRIVQVYHLYYVFVKRWLPPVKPYILLPLIALPWICGAAWSVRHVEFRFHEFKDLLRGIIVSTIAIGLWIAAYIVNEVHEEISWVQVSSRFLLLLMASILVLLFFSISVSQPLLSQMSLTKRETLEVITMSQALGIPEGRSHMVTATTTSMVGDQNQPLDKLLVNKRFLHSFMAFADSCLAGESVHFFEEAHELSRIPVNDPVRRVYMARHIIEKYIASGAEMEVNISHRTRQEILGTSDLACPDLFNRAVGEVIQLMKMNLAKDYWSSIYSIRFREESQDRSDNFELIGRDCTPRPSRVRCTDDPFHQENIHVGL